MLEVEEHDSCAEEGMNPESLIIDEAENSQKSAKADHGQWNISGPDVAHRDFSARVGKDPEPGD
jgi:hypothetical protein